MRASRGGPKKNHAGPLIILSIIFIFAFAATTRAGAELDPENIIARSAVMIDAKTGIVVFDKDMHERLYPASVTKLMTVLLALERAGGGFDDRVYFSRDAVYSLPWDSSNIAMDEGESLTMEQALYAIMLASANEVANAVAEHIAGTAENFARLMTERAAELGANDTRFLNPHGLHEDGHYTTPYDMALIMRECVKHPFFVTLISTEYYEIPPTEKHDEIRGLLNTNRLIRDGDYHNADVVGGKTGFTDQAGHTLVTYAERDGVGLITAVMKDEKNMIYTDTTALLEYGFGMFGDVTVFDGRLPEPKRTLPVYQLYDERTIELGDADVAPAGGLVCFLPLNTDLTKIEKVLSLPDSLEAPVRKGQAVGKLTLSIGGYALGAVALVSKTDVERTDPLELAYEAKSAASKETALVVLSALKTMMFLFALIIAPMFIIRWVNIYRRRRRYTSGIG